MKDLAAKYGVTLNEKRSYLSFDKHYHDEVDRIGWTESLDIFEEFGKTCVRTIQGTHYHTHCKYLDEPITDALVERELKSFVRL
jgi:hypothetical protein